jgi:uncharacterized protein
VKSGVATMRCDDRGVGESTGSMEEADIATFVADAKRIVAFLATRPEIDKKKIGALGHSEGGIVVAELAAAGEVAFVVTLAGPALSGREVSVHQNLDLIVGQGVPADKTEALVKSLDALFLAVSEDKPDAELEALAKTMAEAVLAARGDGNAPPEAVQMLTQQYLQLA